MFTYCSSFKISSRKTIILCVVFAVRVVLYCVFCNVHCTCVCDVFVSQWRGGGEQTGVSEA